MDTISNDLPNWQDADYNPDIFDDYDKNLSWYATLLPTKVYRQLINRFEMENGIGLSELDYQNTREIIKEILEIWFDSSAED